MPEQRSRVVGQHDLQQLKFFSNNPIGIIILDSMLPIIYGSIISIIINNAA